MKNQHITTVISVLIAVAGLSLLLYPTVSDFINSLGHRRTISEYERSVNAIDDSEYEKMIADARAFNAELAKTPTALYYSDEQLTRYNQLLNVSDTGMMGYIEIPSIDVSLPIYHGSSKAVLQKNVGHVEGSSLPIGGESTHSVLSGHRGLPSATLFTNLDKLKIGDTFTIKVLKESYIYEVDQILTVLPDEPAARDAIMIEEGKDYCTLVTCTPYGINTHRLLVRGHRVEAADDTPDDSNTATDLLNGRTENASQINAFIITAIVETPIILILAIFVAVHYIRRRR